MSVLHLLKRQFQYGNVKLLVGYTLKTFRIPAFL